MTEKRVQGRTETASKRQARRALERQLAHQRAKAQRIEGLEEEFIAAMHMRARRVREILERIRPLSMDDRVLEVGSGAHGLIFFIGAAHSVGCDPLALHYASLFPAWQRGVRTLAALGEALPFADSTFDVVLCDNVIDHAERPGQVVGELVRVLAPGGLLYFTVNVHHPVYSVAAAAHAAWNAAGVHIEIGPFADHTVHLTLNGARQLFEGMPLRTFSERHYISEAKSSARRLPARHPGDLLKRAFFKNALYELVAGHDSGFRPAGNVNTGEVHQLPRVL